MRFSFSYLMSTIYKVNCTIKIQRWWRRTMRNKLQRELQRELQRNQIIDMVIR